VKCSKRRTDGEPCGGQAVAGTDACTAHAGTTLARHKAKGDVVVTLRRWGVDDIPEEPGALLLKLMSVTEWRRQDYEAEIARVVADGQYATLADALVGESVVVDKNGSPHVVGEYVRGIVQLEQQERKLAAELAIKALAAGVMERLTRVAEQQQELVAEYMHRVLAALGHDVQDPIVLRVLSEQLPALGASA
jgi:hypothetical protein